MTCQSLPTAISSVSHGARSPLHCIVTGLQPLQTAVTQNSGFAAAVQWICGSINWSFSRCAKPDCFVEGKRADKHKYIIPRISNHLDLGCFTLKLMGSGYHTWLAPEKEKCGKDQHVTQYSDAAVGPDHTAHAPQYPFNVKQVASQTRLESRRARNSDASRFVWSLRHLQDSFLLKITYHFCQIQSWGLWDRGWWRPCRSPLAPSMLCCPTLLCIPALLTVRRMKILRMIIMKIQKESSEHLREEVNSLVCKELWQIFQDLYFTNVENPDLMMTWMNRRRTVSLL